MLPIGVVIYLFVVYLMSRSKTLDYIPSNGRIISEYESERMWKEAVVAQFNVLHQYVLGGTEENGENLRISNIQAQI
jgi:hypothetical protein